MRGTMLKRVKLFENLIYKWSKLTSERQYLQLPWCKHEESSGSALMIMFHICKMWVDVHSQNWRNWRKAISTLSDPSEPLWELCSSDTGGFSRFVKARCLLSLYRPSLCCFVHVFESFVPSLQKRKSELFNRNIDVQTSENMPHDKTKMFCLHYLLSNFLVFPWLFLHFSYFWLSFYHPTTLKNPESSLNLHSTSFHM